MKRQLQLIVYVLQSMMSGADSNLRQKVKDFDIKFDKS